VIELLLRDHRLLTQLLDRLDTEDRPAEMHALFLRIAGELAAHEAAEEDVVFPAALAAIPVDQPEVRDLMAGHEEVNSLLAEMLQLDPASFGFLKRASALVLDLRAHFAAEEEVLFPLLRSVLGPVERGRARRPYPSRRALRTCVSPGRRNGPHQRIDRGGGACSNGNPAPGQWLRRSRPGTAARRSRSGIRSFRAAATAPVSPRARTRPPIPATSRPATMSVQAIGSRAVPLAVL
jgi:hemerythrin superfamily protein